MIIMNKLYKCALGLLTAFALSFACFSSAVTLDNHDYPDEMVFRLQTAYGQVDLSPSQPGITCVELNSADGGTFYDGETTYTFYDWALYCTDSDTVILTTNGSKQYYWYYYSENVIKTFYPDYTSMQCQTEYNLIPISEVTANYCKLNFDLIDPQECPINQGTGAIVRSNLMINDVPYAQNQNINVFIPDFLSWNLSFNDLYTVIEVEGYNADEEYIENVINQEKLTPTPEDLTYLIQGTANFIPYLFVGLLILFAVKIFGKIWK